jgi:GNAT superfamily N-acetyltransferase
VRYEADLPEDLRHGNVPVVGELAAAYRGPNAAFLAVSRRSAMGCVAVRELDSTTGIVMRLFVVPDARRIGAARSLVTAAIEFARAREFQRLVLDTNKHQLMPAYRLYRSFGFEECEPFAAVTYECPTFMELRLQRESEERSRRSDLNR